MENEINCFTCTNFCKQIFSNAEIQSIEDNRSNLFFDAGETIVKQGGLVSNIVSLRKGIVKVVFEDRQNKNTILNIVKESNLLGLSVLGNQKTYPFSIVALSHVNICQIRREAVISAMQQSEAVNSHITNWYSQHMIQMARQISIFNTRNNHGKLASAIYNLYENFNDYNIFEHISRKELAEYACISLESVNKILLQLKNDKIIDLDNKNLKLLQPELIKRLSYIG